MHEFKAAKDNPEMRAAIEAVIALLKQSGLSLSHEDSHGGFIIEKYSDHNADWLRDAQDMTKAVKP